MKDFSIQLDEENMVLILKWKEDKTVFRVEVPMKYFKLFKGE